MLPDQDIGKAYQRFGIVVLGFAFESFYWEIETGFDECELRGVIRYSDQKLGTVHCSSALYGRNGTHRVYTQMILLCSQVSQLLWNNALTATVPWDLIMSDMPLLQTINFVRNQLSGNLPTSKPKAWPGVQVFYAEEDLLSREPFHPIMCN